jgi:hypothetical protein
MIDSLSRATTYQAQKNSNETVRIEYEVYLGSPIVSIRSYRGDKFTGKGISLEPSLMLSILPEVEKAVHEFKAIMVMQYGEEAAAETAKKERKSKRKTVAAEATS